MVGELGHLALIWVAVSSTITSVIYAWQKWHQQQYPGSLSIVAKLNAVAALLSLVALGYLFTFDQFHFYYVAAHSNSALPLLFKVAAVWGGHEGSMLFWVFTLALWSALISQIGNMPCAYRQDVLWLMGLLVAAFAWFTLLTSNPFLYSEQWLEQGRDLNPMLQDIGLIFHPPLLYLGYIGFSTVLTFAIAALMQSEVEEAWVALARPWATLAWMFLTLGILVGSWWAYNELGWGGWWFWDPVENASLLPWLTGTALMHSLLAADKHKQQTHTALALALVTFSLSILGTFVVRSGVLTSVHAFAVDPGKGVALLAILAVVLLTGFGLLLVRSESVLSHRVQSLFGRGYLAVLAVGLLSIASFTVILGTFYPMGYQLITRGSISVGAPYFNTLFMPLSIIALMLLGIAPVLKWHQGSEVNRNKALLGFVISTLLGVVCYWLQVEVISLAVAAVWALAMWVALSHLWLSFRVGKLTFMIAAHIGFAISCVGAVMNAEHSYELNKKMAAGTRVEIPDGWLTYRTTDWVIGPNYTAEQGVIDLVHQGRHYQLTPERRYYPVRVMNMSEPAIKSFWHGDYYLTLASKVDQHSYAVKIQYKSYISWIWGGGLLAMIGGLLSFTFRPREKVRHGACEQV
ncbi:heme lyase CcmF/NrfE family subunit [Vibrio sinaloensis]|uniref:heme lyase CcmF/NrfE family subunit n=1 Tax=Photobacterium sp. (strain ATCC 43367) TaxID=379097 RepID=UPI00206401B0|nr:heme lyase CcmF/NrfE family subunit [Vibrio sinaloensis]UPQ87265.1 heme lyase CcmF/NrfE family subunit [Vibrio sinaloensis]